MGQLWAMQRLEQQVVQHERHVEDRVSDMDDLEVDHPGSVDADEDVQSVGKGSAKQFDGVDCPSAGSVHDLLATKPRKPSGSNSAT